MDTAVNTINKLEQGNRRFIEERRQTLQKHVTGQSPCCAVLTCADSRVIPEHIFDTDIGELFVVRVAGNIAVDGTVLASLEFAVGHLNADHLIILGHTHCGAVRLAEETQTDENPIIAEIRESFPLHEMDHVSANVLRQIEMVPKRSRCIEQAVKENRLQLHAAIYHLDDGHVEYLDK